MNESLVFFLSSCCSERGEGGGLTSRHIKQTGHDAAAAAERARAPPTSAAVITGASRPQTDHSPP